ncbi:D-arabinono-1,4-lactone oxidase [Pseudactinotalea sp. Z1732]|uniref:D-arabinono-1,4-lactone oxidase n=1 Tax=Micrococcales TaxID=85006 RepID=UPI003C7D2B56
MDEAAAREYRTWSGSVRFTPGRHLEPADEGELARIIGRAREHGHTVRPRGSGHSSTPLIASEDVLVSLDGLSGLIDHDTEAGLARLGAGTTLDQAGAELAQVGLAMENFGDVSYQTLAGAIGTGTHGTGLQFGNLSTLLAGGRMVTGTGEVLDFGFDDDASPATAPPPGSRPVGGDDGIARAGAGAGRTEDALLRAIGVSLGTIGVMTAVTIRATPEYDLRRLEWSAGAEWAIDHFLELSLTNRNADIYWYPRRDEVKVRTLNLPEHTASVMPADAHVVTEQTGPSHEIIPTVPPLRFDEMEYLFPLEVGMDVFQAVRERIKSRHRHHVAWRVLVRTIAADDLMLSNATGHDSMSIALLHNADLPEDPYFADMEPLLLDYGGRPHWGKKHSRTATHLAPMYPQWQHFQQIRRRHDPDGVLMNDYLRSLLEQDQDGANGGQS